MFRVICTTAVLAVLVVDASNAQAQTKISVEMDRPIIVGVYESPPMVIRGTDGRYRGFDIELWEAIAEELDAPYRIEHQPSFNALLNKVQSGELDVGMSGITINEERESRLDFTHPYYNSGLRIMVRPEDASQVRAFWSAVCESDVWKWIGVYFLCLVFFAHIVWWSERGENAIDDCYLPGIFQALWFSSVTSTTVGYGDIAPKKWVGRVVATLLMYIGIGLAGVLIGSITSVMTVDSLEADVSTIDDLRGKRVATVQGTTSADRLRVLGSSVAHVSSVTQAYDRLEKRQVDAVVFDAPMLVHHARTDGAGKVMVTGALFDRQDYGIALPEDTRLREPINRALLKLRRNGVYDTIYRRWFGSE